MALGQDQASQFRRFYRSRKHIPMGMKFVQFGRMEPYVEIRITTGSSDTVGDRLCLRDSVLRDKDGGLYEVPRGMARLFCPDTQ